MIQVTPELIHPIKKGHKTCTSRLAGLDEINKQPDRWKFVDFSGIDHCGRSVAIFRDGPAYWKAACPYGATGSHIWVRENWYVGKGYDGLKAVLLPTPGMVGIKIGYIADGKKPEWAGKTRPSIFMPRWASRVDLTVTGIQAKRVQDITEDECSREGVERGIFREGPNTEAGEFQLEHNNHATYRDGFKFIFSQINGYETWKQNPWVWLVSFKLLTFKSPQ